MTTPLEPEVVTRDISSLNTLAGQGNPRSLRLQGNISNQSFQVLIDSGSTHNFIKPAIMEKLGLSVKPTTPFRVYIGNGDHLLCSYYCPHVTIVLQGNSFFLDLYLLPIEGPEVVLGIQWLQSLGRVCHDYKALIMEFSWKGETIILRGDLSTTCKAVTFSQLQALFGSRGVCGTL